MLWTLKFSHWSFKAYESNIKMLSVWHSDFSYRSFIAVINGRPSIVTTTWATLWSCVPPLLTPAVELASPSVPVTPSPRRTSLWVSISITPPTSKVLTALLYCSTYCCNANRYAPAVWVIEIIELLSTPDSYITLHYSFFSGQLKW